MKDNLKQNILSKKENLSINTDGISDIISNSAVKTFVKNGTFVCYDFNSIDAFIASHKLKHVRN